ncbi:type II toxin-antitoxin system prevent-host-death family antitoxin [Xanthobacteraceae bacterium A53D]
MPATLTRRQINGDIARAKRAAQDGPVFITEHGRPSHVLITYESWQTLTREQPTLLDLIGNDAAAAVPFESELLKGVKLINPWSAPAD